MPEANLTAEAALQRLQRIMRRWPRPGDGEGVRVDAVLSGMAPLVPIAEMLLRMPIGYQKGYYSGVGYLSGSDKLTAADRALAQSVLRDVRTDLPAARGQALTRMGYAKLKERAYKLLMLAADFDVTSADLDKVGIEAGRAWDAWISLSPVVPLESSVASGAARAGDVANKAEASLRRFERFMSAFPRPGEGQIVKFEALIVALKQLEPLANKIAALPVGTPKSVVNAAMWKEALSGGFKGFVIMVAAPWSLPFWGIRDVVTTTGTRPAYSGAGYLTGAEITVADRDCANRIRYELNVRLPSYKIDPNKWPADAPWVYEQIKAQCIQLLKIATDMDVTEDDLDRAAGAFEALGDAVMALPGRLRDVYHETIKTGTDIGQMLVWLVLGGGGLYLLGSIIARR